MRRPLCLQTCFPPGRDNITASVAAVAFGWCYSEPGFSLSPGFGVGSGSGFLSSPPELAELEVLLDAELDAELEVLDELLELDDSLGFSSSPPMIVTSLVKSQVFAGLYVIFSLVVGNCSMGLPASAAFMKLRQMGAHVLPP